MVAVPCAIPFTTPSEVTVAMLELLEVQVTDCSASVGRTVLVRVLFSFCFRVRVVGVMVILVTGELGLFG